jgi:hypothetical protein
MELNPGLANNLLRLRSCIETILEIHQALETETLAPDLARRLDELKSLMTKLDQASLVEQDVSLVEAATNHLLKELEPLMEAKGLEKIFKKTIH